MFELFSVLVTSAVFFGWVGIKNLKAQPPVEVELEEARPIRAQLRLVR